MTSGNLPSIMFWGHTGANWVVFLVSAQGDGGSGGWKRRSPVGGAAYGTPRNWITGPKISLLSSFLIPLIFPKLVVTTGLVSSNFWEDTAAAWSRNPSTEKAKVAFNPACSRRAAVALHTQFSHRDLGKAMVPHQLCSYSEAIWFVSTGVKTGRPGGNRSSFLNRRLSEKSQKAFHAVSIFHWFHTYWSCIFTQHYLSDYILLTILFSIAAIWREQPFTAESPLINQIQLAAGLYPGENENKSLVWKS